MSEPATQEEAAAETKQLVDKEALCKKWGADYWIALQKEGSELNVFERGMGLPQLEVAVAEALASGARSRPEERRTQEGRTPFGQRKMNLEIPERIKQPGLYYRFFIPDNFNRAREAGFIPVLDSGEDYAATSEHEDSRNWYQVAKGRNQDGSPQVLYLWAQPQAFRDEDKAIRRSQRDERDQAIEEGSPADGGVEQGYNPEVRPGVPVRNVVSKPQS